MHLGAMTTDALTAWARGEGASAEASRLLARELVGSFAGRTTGLPISHRLKSRADSVLGTALPEAIPVTDSDGTVRYAVRYADGALVEAVVIPHPLRTTVCLSTQAGCARGCVFCETGRLGLTRNLAAEEITGQFAAVTRSLVALGRPAPTNIVFMGMGEPLDNLDAVLTACEVLSDNCGFAIAPRRITVSTVGVVPKIREFHKRAKVRLAVSLHAANDAEREALLPVARSWNLAELRAALAESKESVLIQWTLIAGVNDSERHARELLAFCDGLDVRINLIPLNPGPEETLRAPSIEQVRAFQKRLSDAGARTLVRMPHGQEVGGACGQLAGSLRDRPEEKPRLPVIGKAPRLR
jgi:23S rRNA (adenine2503-C2)-methyltransferase